MAILGAERKTETIFLRRYRLLSNRTCEGISEINGFKNKSVKIVEVLKTKDLSSVERTMPINILADALFLKLSPGQDSSVFFSQPYYEETIKAIGELQRIHVRPESCANWSMGFSLFRRFMNDASLELRKHALADVGKMPDGGGITCDYEDLLMRFCVSLETVQHMLFKMNSDLDKSCVHFLESKNLRSYESTLRLQDLYQVIDVLREKGFFFTRSDNYYEKVFGKTTMGLLKSYLKSG